MTFAAVLARLQSRLERALAPPRARYRPLWMDGAAAGWVDDARAERLHGMTDVFTVRHDRIGFVAGIVGDAARTAALDRVARRLASEGRLTAWRDERYAIAPAFGAAPWFELERAAARFFGVHTYAAHVNGVVRADEGVTMWLARRSETKAIDPGMLDNLVGGGIAAGHSVAATVVKESWEEAGLDAVQAARALPAGTLEICREQPDGLQRETIFVHDLWLPLDFTPRGQDDEVVAHRRVGLAEAALLIAVEDGRDAVTADASLVILDFLLRHRFIGPDEPEFRDLSDLRHPRTSMA